MELVPELIVCAEPFPDEALPEEKNLLLLLNNEQTSDKHRQSINKLIIRVILVSNRKASHPLADDLLLEVEDATDMALFDAAPAGADFGVLSATFLLLALALFDFDLLFDAPCISLASILLWRDMITCR